jgi:hypothetical protein
MGSGDPPGLQNRRTASLMSSVRSTRTRFRHSRFNGIANDQRWLQQSLGLSLRTV